MIKLFSLSYSQKLGDSDQNTPPLIADIKTYDDGTILVHVIRNESIQTDDFREIDPNLKLDPINYCLLKSDSTEYKINRLNNIVIYLNDTKKNNTNVLHNLVNPITVYPLQKPFILVTYVKTKISFDPTTYEECGEVIDWDGISRSKLCFDFGVWINSSIQLNANKKLGFLRCALNSSYAWQMRQYSIDDSGKLTHLTNLGEIYNVANLLYSQCSLVTIVSTVDNGYLAIFNYTGKSYNDNSLSPLGGLFAIFINYSQTSYNKTQDNYDDDINYIYQITQPNIIINSVYCDVSGRFIICMVSIISNNATGYVQIYLKSSGNVIKLLTNVTNQTQQGLRAKTMPFGGYILGVTAYDDNDNNTYHYIYTYDDYNVQIPLKLPGPFLTNYFGVNTITQNNTFLLASPYTNDNISWSLLTISLPSVNDDHGYDNIMINKTIPSINAIVNSSIFFFSISFNYPIVLSATTSNITIYKTSDNSIRQRISTMHGFCNISPDEHTVSIFVLSTTFNEYGEQYFVTMNNNFVKYKFGNEPLKGIHDGIWILKTDMPNNPNNQKRYSDKDTYGLVRLTQGASLKFLDFQTNQSAYIDSLLNELAKKVPINRSRLSSNNQFQNVASYQIIIPIIVYAANNEFERSSLELSFDLSILITSKNMNAFSFGVTNDLDQNYGFRILRRFIIPFKNAEKLNKY
ncbi:hypothetical protein C2G38_2157943 [Gigaspora rosea]|uniref:Uncharacterized protein n=1 Tax=Gigaspora rosea TaxID=44941 RepID=A0A397W7Y1_9GLOM|nr:hypothetical protein C2G38_2157943 [Gigaspora rosea]